MKKIFSCFYPKLVTHKLGFLNFVLLSIGIFNFKTADHILSLKKLENEFSCSSVMDEETENPVPDAEYYPREKYGAANLYAAKKTVAQGMMDVALITANANQLRFVVEYNQSSPTYAIAISLITISLILQIVVGICLIFKGRCDLKGEKKFKQANTMNNYIVVGVFIITIVNVFVAAFSTGPPPLTKTSE